MASGTITRKEIIEDEALQWGKDYAKNLEGAIEKNKQFVEAILALKAANDKLRNSPDAKAYNDNLRQTNEIGDKAVQIWKEQNQLELALISTKKKNELATEGTNRALTKERILLQEVNKEVKQQTREQLGMVTAYERLNKARKDAQDRLANLLSAEKKSTAEVIIAEREFKKLDARVKAVDAAINNYSKNIGNYQSAFTGLNKTARELLSTFGVVTGFALFGTIVKDIFNVIKDFDRQLIAVGKTTNISGENLKQLGREVVALGQKLNGVNVDGLIKSAEVAGQLGVTGTANILKFSEAIEKLKLTSNIISDEQVGQFAKFIEVSSDSFDNADRLASVITRLGNEMATTESEVLANSTEIQKGIAVYNTSAQGVLALGAATSTLGSEAEASRSAIQSTFAIVNKAVATGKNLEEILKLTGLTQAELSKQFNKDATGVFVKFVKGLNAAKNEGRNLSIVLEDLGITEKRAFTVVGTLAANYGVLENAMKSASDEYEDNLALNKEVAAASESLASIISDIKDNFDAYILSADDANGGTARLASALKFLRDNLSQIIDFTIKLGSVIVSYVVAMKTANFVVATGTALQSAWVAGQIRFALATGIGTKSILAQAQAARAATVAQTGLNVATKATPWGLIIGLIAAAVVAYKVFNEQLTKAEESQNRVNDALLKQTKNAEASRKASDDFYQSQLKNIEDEYALRRARQGDSQKLDQEEIDAKKKTTQSNIETNQMIIKANRDLINKIKADSTEKIKVLEAEAIRLRAIADNTSGYGNDVAAERAEAELIALKEQTNIKINALRTDSNAFIEQNKTLNAALANLNKQNAIKSAEQIAEETKKARAARLKALKERYELEKKAIDDEFKLRQFRLQVAIDLEDDIFQNEKKGYDERLESLLDFQQFKNAKTKEAAEFELQQLGKYNEETGKFTRQLSDAEIKTFIETGNLKKKITNEQRLIYEKYQNDLTETAKKGELDRQKLIDGQVDVLRKSIDQQLLDEDTRLQNSLTAQTKIYRQELEAAEGNFKLIEQARQRHEKAIFDIKKQFAIDGLKLQSNEVQAQLDSNDSKDESERVSADVRRKIVNDLANYRSQINELETQNYVENVDARLLVEQMFADKAKELALALKDALVELTNAIFEARISNIDNELQMEQEKYDQSIEAAGNDERKKALLTEEFEKKRKKLEAEKRKEQIKAAIFNKVIALSQIALNLAQTISAINLAAATIDAITPFAFGAAGATYRAFSIPFAIGVAAVQAASVLATPLPKYKHGRKDGPDEFAIVGDGGVPEVISDPDGSNPQITPNKPTLTFLKRKKRVHRSIDAYNEYMRDSIMNNLGDEKRKMQDFQANVNVYNNNSELLEEMRLTRKTFEKMKTNVTVNLPKSDLNHELWKFQNTNWKR